MFRNEESTSRKIIDRHIDGKMEQVKLTKYEFEDRDIWKLIAPPGISGPPGFHCTEQKQGFSIGHANTSTKFKIETLKEIKSVVLKNTSLKIEMGIFLEKFWQVLTFKISMQERKW